MLSAQLCKILEMQNDLHPPDAPFTLSEPQKVSSTTHCVLTSDYSFSDLYRQTIVYCIHVTRHRRIQADQCH
jgi:hypothetical protein